MSKDRSKDILREIKALREDLGLRIERLEEVVGLSPNERASVHETEVADAGPRVVPDRASVNRVLPPAMPGVMPGAGSMPAIGSTGTPRSLSVVVQPLVDLGLARAVESSLRDTEGIESARLVSLSGNSAVIDAQVSPGVSVISALRRSLPIAFDVTDSSDDSVTIELALPATDASEPPDASQEAGT